MLNRMRKAVRQLGRRVKAAGYVAREPGGGILES
jgi:hypothetical protein